MRYLKEHVKGLGRDLTDMEAAIAYCTRSGVVIDPKTGIMKADRFVAWAKDGYAPDKLEVTKKRPENRDRAVKRRAELYQYLGSADEFWRCGKAACWTTQ